MNKLAIGEFSHYFDPQLESEVSLGCYPNSHEDTAKPSGYEVPIPVVNSQSVSDTPPPTKTPPMTMALSTDDPFITKYNVPITFSKLHNHRKFGVILQFPVVV